MSRRLIVSPANSALPNQGRHKSLTLFSGPFKALRSLGPLQLRKRLLVSNRGLMAIANRIAAKRLKFLRRGIYIGHPQPPILHRRTPRKPNNQNRFRIFGFVPSDIHKPMSPSQPYRCLPARTPPQSSACPATVSPARRPSFLEPNPTRGGITDVEPNLPTRVIFRTCASQET